MGRWRKSAILKYSGPTPKIIFLGVATLLIALFLKGLELAISKFLITLDLGNAVDFSFYYYMLSVIAFILIIALFVQLVETALKKLMPPLYKALGVYLPLITTNCAVLGLTILNIDNEYSFFHSIENAFFSGAGFLMVLLLFSGVRSRVEEADVPETFKGVPATLIAAAILSLSFLGFSGIGG